MSGKLVVYVFKARNLVITDLIGKSDPYVVLSFQGAQQKTKVVRDTLDPEWNETFQFDVIEGGSLDLSLAVWDEDVSSKDDLQGKASLDISYHKNDNTPRWVTLQEGTGQNGELFILINWDAPAPVPVSALPPSGQHLFVTIVKARNLPLTDDNGTGAIDPYIRITLGDQVFRTSKKSNDCNPIYNETFKFIDPPGTDYIQFTLFDVEDSGPAEWIAKCLLVSDNLPKGESWVVMVGKVGQWCGDLLVEIHRDPISPTSKATPASFIAPVPTSFVAPDFIQVFITNFNGVDKPYEFKSNWTLLQVKMILGELFSTPPGNLVLINNSDQTILNGDVKTLGELGIDNAARLSVTSILSGVQLSSLHVVLIRRNGTVFSFNLVTEENATVGKVKTDIAKRVGKDIERAQKALAAGGGGGGNGSDNSGGGVLNFDLHIKAGNRLVAVGGNEEAVLKDCFAGGNEDNVAFVVL